jgi:hypothetical protein
MGMNSVFKQNVTRLSARVYRWSVCLLDETMATGYEPTRQKALSEGASFIRAALDALPRKKSLTNGDKPSQSGSMIGNHQPEGAPQ